MIILNNSSGHSYLVPGYNGVLHNAGFGLKGKSFAMLRKQPPILILPEEFLLNCL